MISNIDSYRLHPDNTSRRNVPWIIFVSYLVLDPLKINFTTYTDTPLSWLMCDAMVNLILCCVDILRKTITPSDNEYTDNKHDLFFFFFLLMHVQNWKQGLAEGMTWDLVSAWLADPVLGYEKSR